MGRTHLILSYALIWIGRERFMADFTHLVTREAPAGL